MKRNWLDRAVGYVSPEWELRRLRARGAANVIRRHFEGASDGRRTQGWRRPSTDANAAVGPALARLRDLARDLIRNNPYAESALETIIEHTIGWGIVPAHDNALFKAWSESTLCDADGRCNLAGLQALAVGTMAESGEVLIRRRWRKLEDGLPLPFQLQILEPDFIDTLKDGVQPNGHRCIQGVEYDLLGRRVAYWLYKQHPGAIGAGALFGQSQRVPATEIAHMFRARRPGQVRGVTWYAPVLLRFKDLDEYEDAQLMKQKIAACLAVITSDVNGLSDPLGTAEDGAESTDHQIDTIEPGSILNIQPGRSVEVVSPPSVREFTDYMRTNLRGIATGLGVTYEDLTGDYQNLPFSAARMSRMRHWGRVQGWRWRIVVPQMLNPVWSWAVEAAAVMGTELPLTTDWDAPALAMIEPDKEGLAILRNIRAGIQTHSNAIRERGWNPRKFREELAADFKALDDLGLVLDIDPRRMTAQGQAQGTATSSEEAPEPEEEEEPEPEPEPEDEADDTDEEREEREERAREMRDVRGELREIRSSIARQPAPIINNNITPPAVSVPVTVQAPTTIERGAFESNVTVPASPETVVEKTIVRDDKQQITGIKEVRKPASREE